MAVMMRAVSTLVDLVDSYQSTQHNNPEESLIFILATIRT
jgi:hypothetical protein